MTAPRASLIRHGLASEGPDPTTPQPRTRLTLLPAESRSSSAQGSACPKPVSIAYDSISIEFLNQAGSIESVSERWIRRCIEWLHIVTFHMSCQFQLLQATSTINDHAMGSPLYRS